MFLQPWSFRISGCGFLSKEEFPFSFGHCSLLTQTALEKAHMFQWAKWSREQRHPCTSAVATWTDKTLVEIKSSMSWSSWQNCALFGRCGQNRNSMHQSGSMVTKKQRDATILELFHSQMRQGFIRWNINLFFKLFCFSTTEASTPI